MKKAAKLIYFLGILGFLVSCGPKNNEDTTPKTDEPIEEKEDKKDEEKEEPKDEPQDDPQDDPKKDEDEKFYIWDEITDNAYLNTIGRIVPKLECASYEYEIGEDDYGDPTMNIYCYFATEDEANAALEPYAWYLYTEDKYECTIQENYRIYVSYFEYIETTILFADRKVNKKKAIELQCLVSERNGQPCLGIFAFTYIPQSPNAWPVYAVEDLLGQKNDMVPYDEEGCTYEFQFFKDQYGYEVLEIHIEDPVNGYESEELYFNKLLDLGYVVAGVNDYTDTSTYYHRPGGISDDGTVYHTEYPYFEDSEYYESMTDDAYIIFDYNLSSGELILDIYNVHEIWPDEE